MKLLAMVKPPKPISQMTAAERKRLADELFRVASINAADAAEGQ